MKKYFPLNFHLVYQKDLPKNSFKVEGNHHNVPCVFQIWKKQNKNRRIPKRLSPYGFVFCRKSEKPDIAVRRLGGAGRISIDIISQNNHSNYFIKFINGESLKRNIKRINKAKFRRGE